MATGSTTRIDLDALRREYIHTPDDAVFLTRAKVLADAAGRFAELPPGERQGRIVEALCREMPIRVLPCDALLGRFVEEVPRGEDEAFARDNPQFFTAAGVPGLLDSAGLYCPQWSLLLDRGLAGLADDVSRVAQACGDAARRDWLEGVRLSLGVVGALARRLAAEAREMAGAAVEPDAARLRGAAAAMERVCGEPPGTFREALQLFLLFHSVLAAVVGGRNVTPGRMDRYLACFYEADVASGALVRQEAVEFLAAAFVMMSQGSGSVSTDFQSTKRTPNHYSHYYITLAGRDADGRARTNDLSWAILDAIELAGTREPTAAIRYTEDIDRAFWLRAVSLMRDGRPVIAFNDESILGGLERCGIAREAALDYVQNGLRQLPPVRPRHAGASRQRQHARSHPARDGPCGRRRLLRLRRVLRRRARGDAPRDRREGRSLRDRGGAAAACRLAALRRAPRSRA